MAEQLIKDVQAWALEAERDIRATGRSYGISHASGSPSPSASIERIKSRVLLQAGTTTGVAFRFPRSLVYPHYGAGKGQGGKKGSRWTTAAGISKRTNPKSLGKAGTGNRQSKPFFNDSLNRTVPNLADIVANTSADIVTAKLFT